MVTFGALYWDRNFDFCLSSLMQNSGIENLVEELCSKLKDIQNKQKGWLYAFHHTLLRFDESIAKQKINTFGSFYRRKADRKEI